MDPADQILGGESRVQTPAALTHNVSLSAAPTFC